MTDWGNLPWLPDILVNLGLYHSRLWPTVFLAMSCVFCEDEWEMHVWGETNGHDDVMLRLTGCLDAPIE